MSQGGFAVVTGAGNGIGRAIAIKLAEGGRAVVVSDRDQGAATEVARQITTSGGSALAVMADVRSRDDVASAIATGTQYFATSLAVFVNNAGYNQVCDPFELSDEHWDALFAVNARGTFIGTQLAGAAMRERGSGVIVNIASAVARGPYPNAVHYAASKAAILSLTMSYAKVLAPCGIRVNSIAPAIVDTDLWLDVDRAITHRDGTVPGTALRDRVSEIPIGRAGAAEDVAAAVRFLASDEAAFITGECLHLTGGSLMV